MIVPDDGDDDDKETEVIEGAATKATTRVEDQLKFHLS
jgi:hypothetical protein